MTDLETMMLDSTAKQLQGTLNEGKNLEPGSSLFNLTYFAVVVNAVDFISVATKFNGAKFALMHYIDRFCKNQFEANVAGDIIQKYQAHPDLSEDDLKDIHMVYQATKQMYGVK